MADSTLSEQSVEPRYEARDVAVLGIVLSLFCVCLVVAFALFGSDLLVAYFAPPESRPVRSGAGSSAPGTPEPLLQTNPGQHLATMRRAEDSLLQGYAWIDRQSGTVRIPIARAMDLIAAQRLGPQTDSPISPERQTQQPPR